MHVIVFTELRFGWSFRCITFLVDVLWLHGIGDFFLLHYGSGISYCIVLQVVVFSAVLFRLLIFMHHDLLVFYCTMLQLIFCSTTVPAIVTAE